VEALAYFAIGWSWGGANSLAMPYDIKPMRTPGSWPHDGVLVRLYIGLEETGDLRDDLERALQGLGV
jgi:cysteine-S-conjugate beta-lyase